MKIYLIPGLGYDCRIFDNLDLQEFDVTRINWIEPTGNERIHEYANRLWSTLEKSNERKILIGHSLGGIVAQEIASSNQIEKVILISSIKSRKELPLYFKLVKPFRLERFFTRKICLKTVKYWGKYHGLGPEEDQLLFKSMIGNQTNFYLQWALRELSAWQEPKLTQTKVVHIHGTNDKTLPYRLVKNPDYIIEKGSHVCVIKRVEIITEIIKEVIE